MIGLYLVAVGEFLSLSCQGKETDSTVEPLNIIKDTLRTWDSHFVVCREIVHSSEIQNVLRIWKNEYLEL